MEIFKIVGIGFVGAVLAIVLKGYRPEIAIQISIACAIILFVMVAPYLSSVINMFLSLSDRLGVNVEHFYIVLKIIGVAYTVQFGSELCRDAGESAIASKMEFAGKVIVITMSMPIIYSLVNTIVSLAQ